MPEYSIDSRVRAIIALIDEIRNDRIHGASELARQAASVLQVTASRLA
ncbi:hypothetical protein ACFLYR_01255 [Chloroflexota bacterium]